MVSEESGKKGRVIPLVQEVTADDQIKAAQCNCRLQPWGVEEGDGRESIEIRISAEKLFGQWVVVTCGNIGTALLQHQTGEADSTADLKNVFARDRKPGHLLSERESCRPDHAKEWPGRGGDPCSFCAAVLV